MNKTRCWCAPNRFAVIVSGYRKRVGVVRGLCHGEGTLFQDQLKTGIWKEFDGGPAGTT